MAPSPHPRSGTARSTRRGSAEEYPGESPESAVSIAALNETARAVLEGAFVPLWVHGEVSDFRAHRSGHWYFTLRDKTSQIRCVVWSRDRRGIPAPPDEGMHVTAFGQLTVYPARGDMQFAIRRLEAEGDGLWRKALELTRAKLERDGLLAPERKRPLPAHPNTIALITSPDGAALHDIVAVMRRRGATARLVVVPAAVQGDGAPRELCRALDRVTRWGGADVVIIGRGGGSREDLWAFNDERLARALAACAVPTIAAIGHEVDITLCDLVADLRAATPSAAAEAATRSQTEARLELRRAYHRLAAGSAQVVRRSRQRLTRAARDLAGNTRGVADRGRARLRHAAGRLQALSPVATLARGYAVARDSEGRTLSSAERFTPDLPFELVLRDGTVQARATDARPGTPGKP